jgi:pimeloyl-ACP methyl ester carboxylesterase
MFLWTYPEGAAPYSQVGDSLDLFFQNQAAALANRLDLAGQASAVVNQVRASTGLTDICVVGNSFGAGVILWDFATLANDPNLRCVLISPSELFMPFDEDLPPANPLPGTVLVADALNDVFFLPGPVWVYVRDRTNGPLPAGYRPGFDNPHLIIGEDPTSLDYVFSLIDLAFQTP